MRFRDWGDEIRHASDLQVTCINEKCQFRIGFIRGYEKHGIYIYIERERERENNDII